MEKCYSPQPVYSESLVRFMATGGMMDDWRMTHVPTAADAVTRVRLWKAELGVEKRFA